MTRITSLLLLVCIVLSSGCSRDPSSITAFPEDTVLTAVFDEEGSLLFAWVRHRETPVSVHDDPSGKPSPPGIHISHKVVDGLWFRGKKIEFPVGDKLIAVLPDGAVKTVELSDTEVKEMVSILRDNERRLDESPLKQKILAPFRSAAPSGE